MQLVSAKLSLCGLSSGLLIVALYVWLAQYLRGSMITRVGRGEMDICIHTAIYELVFSRPHYV